MRFVASFLISLCLLLPACAERSVSGGDGSPAGPDLAGDSSKIADLVPGPDRIQVPDIPTPKGCLPSGLQEIKLHRSGAGDWTVAAQADSRHQTITISGAVARQAAATLDHTPQSAAVAGFVVSMPSTMTSVDAARDEAAIQMIGAIKALGAAAALTRPGAKATSHDGHPMIRLSEVRATTAKASDAGTIRAALLPALLHKPAAKLKGVPGPLGDKETRFVIRFATVLRGNGQVLHVGAVTDAVTDTDAVLNSRTRALDLASGGSLGRAAAAPWAGCEAFNVSLPKSRKADIIWVVDDYDSLYDVRHTLSIRAPDIYSLLKQAGIDFRMGVTNVIDPKGTYASFCLGKFCSVVSTNTSHNGGNDRFLLPSEQTEFAACLANPPCFEGQYEYGLVNAKEAVSRHLPRAANKPDKIRSDASLVIVVASEKAPTSLADTIGQANTGTCHLPAANQAKLDTLIKPYLDYFKGTKDPASKLLTFEVIGGVCGGWCKAQRAHGYSEVAAALGGRVNDICAQDLSATLGAIISRIKASYYGAPLKLKFSPLPVSLKVAVDGKILPRSRKGGFSHDLASNTLTFAPGLGPKDGSKVTVSYRRWNSYW